MLLREVIIKLKKNLVVYKVSLCCYNMFCI